MSALKPRLIIAGGGLSGALAALALARTRPDIPFLILEQGKCFGGNHVWSFFDGDFGAEHDWLVEPLVTRRWDGHDVRFPGRCRRFGHGYNSIRSDNLDLEMRRQLRPDQYRFEAEVKDVYQGHVILGSGERLEAEGVIDARGGGDFSGLDLAWQKFVGRTWRFRTPHGLRRPVIMDALVEQTDGYRFVYTLPFTKTELLIEDTYYSANRDLDMPLLRHRIDAYRADQGWTVADLAGEERGILPIALGGEVSSLWPSQAAPAARIGLRGGFFHPTTGYSLPDAVRNAVLLCEQRDFSGAALHDLFRTRAMRLWEERRFYRLLNRMLFNAAAPDRRYRVLEHFYRLPEATIGRFYAGRSSFFDKLRILSGRPPVPVHKAVMAALGKKR